MAADEVIEWRRRKFITPLDGASRRISEDPMPRYKCKSIAALDIALSGLPAKMRVEADAGTGVSAKTVGELRKVTKVREFGDNNAAGTSSRKRSKNQQGYRSDS